MISWKKLISPPGKAPKDIKEWLGLITDTIKKLKGSENWYDDVSLLTSNSIINNLETGGSDKALSSEQGKILNQKVIEIKSRLDAILNDNDISVGAGREIELQVGNGYIQWRYKGDMEWNNLISITDLQVPGPQGPQGIPGKDGKNGVDGATGSAGRDGTNGVTPNIQIGTISTLEAGRPATVTKRGTLENPIFDFGIPKGNTGATPDMTEFKQNITKQYQDIEAKINKIEQSDIPVTTEIVDGVLNLTTARRQETEMKNNTTIVLPNVDRFTEIYLKFNTTEELTITMPNIKWQKDIKIEANKTYEFIFTYYNSWLGGCIIYE